jgi:hypothetical protein
VQLGEVYAADVVRGEAGQDVIDDDCDDDPCVLTDLPQVFLA